MASKSPASKKRKPYTPGNKTTPQKLHDSKTEVVEEITIIKKKVIRKRKSPPVSNIRFVIDRSGSMQKIKEETIGGFNAFIADQRKIPGKAKVTFIQFDHEYDTVYDGVDLDELPMLSAHTYKPRGYTALYDAVGRALTDGLEYGKADEQNILVVLTDGDENASKEFTQHDVKRLMQRAEDRGWKVVFLGANIDVARVSSGIGMRGAKAVASGIRSAEDLFEKYGKIDGPITVNYCATGAGISDAYMTASATVSMLRSGGGDSLSGAVNNGVLDASSLKPPKTK